MVRSDFILVITAFILSIFYARALFSLEVSAICSAKAYFNFSISFLT